MIDLQQTLAKHFQGKKLHQLAGPDKVNFIHIVAQFMREPMSIKFSRENTARIQAWLSTRNIQGWTDKSDFPSGESFYPLQTPISATPFFDEGFKELFKMLDFTNSGKGGFRQLMLENTVEFALVPPGDKAKIYGIGGSKESILFDKYGAGLEWDKVLMEDAEWAQVADILTAFRAAAYQNYAKVHYDLLEAAAASQADIAWHAPVPAALANTDALYVANRDIQTINIACQTIALACLNKGYGVTPQTQFIVLTPLQLRGRIRQSLGLALQGFGGSPLHNDFNIRQVTTMMLDTVDHYLVGLPGVRMQSGMRLNLEELTEENILARSTTQVDWMRFGAGIGDADQIRRCDIA